VRQDNNLKKNRAESPADAGQPVCLEKENTGGPLKKSVQDPEKSGSAIFDMGFFLFIWFGLVWFVFPSFLL